MYQVHMEADRKAMPANKNMPPDPHLNGKPIYKVGNKVLLIYTFFFIGDNKFFLFGTIQKKKKTIVFRRQWEILLIAEAHKGIQGAIPRDGQWVKGKTKANSAAEGNLQIKHYDQSSYRQNIYCFLPFPGAKLSPWRSASKGICLD